MIYCYKTTQAFTHMPDTKVQPEWDLQSASFCNSCKLNSICDECADQLPQCNYLEITFTVGRDGGVLRKVALRYRLSECVCFVPCGGKHAGHDDECGCCASGHAQTCCEYEQQQTCCVNASDTGHDKRNCMECEHKRHEYEESLVCNISHHSYVGLLETIPTEVHRALTDTNIQKIFRLIKHHLYENWFQEQTYMFLEQVRKRQDFAESSAQAHARVACRSRQRNQNFCHPSQGQ